MKRLCAFFSITSWAFALSVGDSQQTTVPLHCPLLNLSQRALLPALMVFARKRRGADFIWFCRELSRLLPRTDPTRHGDGQRWISEEVTVERAICSWRQSQENDNERPISWALTGERGGKNEMMGWDRLSRTCPLISNTLWRSTACDNVTQATLCDTLGNTVWHPVTQDTRVQAHCAPPPALLHAVLKTRHTHT